MSDNKTNCSLHLVVKDDDLEFSVEGSTMNLTRALTTLMLEDMEFVELFKLSLATYENIQNSNMNLKNIGNNP